MKRIIIGGLLFSLSFMALAQQGVGNTYTLDMFSLLSFALAVAALLLSGFMAWLSWELYKKSSEASDKTQEAVIRIESVVAGVQTDITEIVRRAVGYWIGNGDSASPDVQYDELASKFEELSEQLNGLKEGGQNTDQLNEAIKEIRRAQNQQISNLKSSLFEAKVRSIFPSAEKVPAVNLDQEVQSADEGLNSGLLYMEVLRSVKNATGTGKFKPLLKSVPSLSASIENSPYEDNEGLQITYGAGKNSDFNVHIRREDGAPLKTGKYVVKYRATIESDAA
ncbi:MAG: hypothetical protein Tsb002_34070 [Wenzhouxiangellaceae bacterium]